MEVNLTGRWDVTLKEYGGESKKSELKLVQSAKWIMGIDEGCGCSYHIEGEITENGSFEGQYMALARTAREDPSDGPISLTIKDNGKTLEGSYADRGAKLQYTAFKISEQLR
jgi:hypothetical protein